MKTRTRSSHALILAALSGCFEPNRSSLCSIEPAVPPAGGGVVPPAAPAAPAAPPAPTEEAPITMTSAQLAERNTRAARATMKKEFGTDDPAEVKAKLDRLAKLETDAEESRKAALSREAKLEEDLKAEKAKRETAESERSQARFDAHVQGVCAKNGIRNTEYATFRLASAHAAGDAAFDEAKFMRDLLADPKERMALGIEDVQKVRVETEKLTTTANGLPAPTAPAANQQETKDAFGMTPADWQKRKAQLGIL